MVGAATHGDRSYVFLSCDRNTADAMRDSQKCRCSFGSRTLRCNSPCLGYIPHVGAGAQWVSHSIYCQARRASGSAPSLYGNKNACWRYRCELRNSHRYSHASIGLLRLTRSLQCCKRSGSHKCMFTSCAPSANSGGTARYACGAYPTRHHA